MNNRYKNLILPVFLALLPIAAIFIGERSVPIVIAFILGAYLLERNKKTNFNNNKELLLPYLISISVFLIYTVVSPDIGTSLKVLERQVSLLLMPLIIFSSDLEVERIGVFFKTYILALVIVGIIAAGRLIWFINSFPEWINAIHGPGAREIYLQFKFPHLVGAHPTYWSYLIVIANLLLLGNTYLRVFEKKSLLILIWIVLNFNLLFLSARMPLFINILLHLLALILYIRTVDRISASNRLIFLSIIVLFGILSSFFLPFLKAKLIRLSSDDRFFLWPIAWQKITDNFYILGEGLGMGYKVLKEYLLNNIDPRTYYKGYDLHNQYLRHYLDMGIMGLLSLMYLITYPMIQIKFRFNLKNLPPIGFSLMFLWALITEAALYRLMGVVIFSIFSSIFLLLTQLHLKEEHEVLI